MFPNDVWMLILSSYQDTVDTLVNRGNWNAVRIIIQQRCLCRVFADTLRHVTYLFSPATVFVDYMNIMASFEHDMTTFRKERENALCLIVTRRLKTINDNNYHKRRLLYESVMETAKCDICRLFGTAKLDYLNFVTIVMLPLATKTFGITGYPQMRMQLQRFIDRVQ